MPTIEVPITDVRIVSNIAGPHPSLPASIVGTNPWSDDDAGTYTETSLGSGFNDWAVGTVAPIPGIVSIEQLRLEATWTATNIGATGADLHIAVEFVDGDLGFLGFYDDDIFYAPAAGVPYSIDTVMAPAEPANLVALFTSGFILSTHRYSNFGMGGDYTLRTHRLVLTLTYTTAGDEETSRRIFPVDRQRNYPPSKSVARGNRRGGGYL